MKRTVIWVALSVLMVLSLVLLSCSGGGSTTTQPTTTTAKPTTTTTTATTPAGTTTTTAPPTTTAKPTTTTTPPATGAQKRGGILKVVTGGVTNLGCPWAINSPPDLWYANPVTETIIRPDENGNYIPWLATSWEYSTDGKALTFKLRQGVKFHDGTDFNAEAVKYNFETQAKSTFPELKALTSAEVVDPYTVKLNFTQFQPQLLGLLAAGRPGWMVSPTAAQKMTPEQLMVNPVGTGPFKLQKYERDVKVTFTRFENYWQQGKPYLDGVEYDIIPDAVTAMMALKAGVVDVHYNMTPKEGSDLQKEGYTVTGAKGSIYQFIPDSANADSPWSKKEVRQAAQYAIDTVSMAKAQGFGWADPYWNQVFPKYSPAYDPTIVGYPYDIAKAKELLAAAGYPKGFKTNIFCTSPPVGDLESAVRNYLGQIGIEAQINPLPGASYNMANTQGWKNGLFRSQSVASVGTDPAYHLSTYLSTPAKQWVSVARPQQLQDLWNKAMGEPDTQKRVANYKEFCKYLIDDQAFIISTWSTSLLAGKQTYVKDDGIRTVWTMTWNPHNAWLDK